MFFYYSCGDFISYFVAYLFPLEYFRGVSIQLLSSDSCLIFALTKVIGVISLCSIAPYVDFKNSVLISLHLLIDLLTFIITFFSHKVSHLM